jgi:hypothetical protein
MRSDEFGASTDIAGDFATRLGSPCGGRWDMDLHVDPELEKSGDANSLFSLSSISGSGEQNTPAQNLSAEGRLASLQRPQKLHVARYLFLPSSEFILFAIKAHLMSIEARAALSPCHHHAMAN